MRSLPLLASLTLLLSIPAQESYWIANRASNDIMQITPWGTVLRRIDMGTSLRSAHTAPDGKVWVVRFIQGTLDLVDPATGTITPIPSVLGSPYFIAFDDQGNAWVSGGTGVQQFAPDGTFLQSFPLTAAAPLGITVDSQGNKWIAHRTTPASVTRIDAAGVVTNFPLPGVATQPTAITADFRGLLQPSHMWVVGDGAAELVEIDELGNLLNIYPLPATSINNVAFDQNGNIWVGSFAAAGTLLQIDRLTGSVLNTYAAPPSVIGLSVDSLGRLLATARTTVAPCEVRRISPTTGAIESPTFLSIGGHLGAGTQSAASTPFQYSLVVAPFADSDGDGDVNFAEVQARTSPTDPASNSAFRVETTGVSSIGNTPNFDIQTNAGTLWILGFSESLLPAGVPVPGFGGELHVDPASLLLTLFGIGSTSLPVGIPNLPSLQGYELFAQGLILGASGFQFQNVTGLKVW